MYNSVAFNIFTRLCKYHHYLVPEHFHSLNNLFLFNIGAFLLYRVSRERKREIAGFLRVLICEVHTRETKNVFRGTDKMDKG